MSFRNSITIVASPRPRLGKTLLARLLLDYHQHEGRAVRGFDLNSDDGTFAQFLPGQVTPSDIASVQGQMALFDSLIAGDGTFKVVDLGHESFQSFFVLANQIGFTGEARRRGLAPVVLFMISPDRVSVEAYRLLRDWFPRATLSPVHNEMLGAAQHRDKFPTSGSSAAQLRFPVLAPGLRRFIETPPLSFSDAQLTDARFVPLDAQSELQRWIRRVHLEFRELDLRILLADLQSAIRL